MYVYNSTEVLKTQQNKYKNRPLKNVDGFASLAKVSVGSVPAVRTIKRTLENDSWTFQRKADYCRLMLSYVDPSDRDKLTSRLEQRLSALQPDTPIADTTPKMGVMRLTQAHIKLDPHMIRAANDLNEIRLGWLYFIARTIDSEKHGSGMVSLDDLKQYLEDIGQSVTSSFYRWIDEGQSAGYWQYDKKQRRIRYNRLEAVADSLMYRLPESRLADYMGNNAMGAGMVWTDCTGTLQALKGAVMGAWIEQRADDITISNKRLATMWGVGIRTVQYWRASSKLESTANYVENDYLENVPQHAKPSKNGHIWRIPNTYHAPHAARQHNHIGRGRKVRQVVNSRLQGRGFNPDSICDVGQAITRYFVGSTDKTAVEQAESYHERVGHASVPQYAQSEVKHYKNGRVGLWSYVGLQDVFAC